MTPKNDVLAGHPGPDDSGKLPGSARPAPRLRHRLTASIEQTSGKPPGRELRHSIYPALLKLEQENYIQSEWGQSDNNRRAKFYKLTRAGHKQLRQEARDWEQTTAILARFLTPDSGS